MRRREFLTLLGGAAVANPLAANAQPVPVIGFLSGRSPGESATVVAAFRRGLGEAGFVEGRNLHMAFRWAEGQYDRLPKLAADLVAQQVAVIAAVAGGVFAAKPATTRIPIVFVMGEGDAVKTGLVASLNRPGGNVTGIAPITSVLGPKRLQVLHEVVPKATLIGHLVNPTWSDTEMQTRDALEAARLLGIELEEVTANTERDIEAAFATFVQRQVGALLCGDDAYFLGQRQLLADLAARHAIPAIYSFREYAMAGGLMSYAPSLADAYRQAGVYVGRILNGEKPADLPVVQPTKFEFIINLKAAKALGLEVPSTLLAQADEVIE
jgi:putative tryptophan/tyrosine transport system substrate-binding protein